MRRQVVSLAIASILCGGCLNDATEVSVAPRAVVLELQVDQSERALREGVYRVRAIGCSGVATGTAFSVGDGQFVTNRHVVDGAVRIELDTWDGAVYPVQAVLVAEGRHLDLAVLVSDLERPALGAFREASVGDTVAVAGYPGGRTWEMRTGEVLDTVLGNDLDPEQYTLRVMVGVERGNSGGPVVSLDNEIVGVVFAGNGSVALAVPANELSGFIHNSKRMEMSTC